MSVLSGFAVWYCCGAILLSIELSLFLEDKYEAVEHLNKIIEYRILDIGRCWKFG